MSIFTLMPHNIKMYIKLATSDATLSSIFNLLNITDVYVIADWLTDKSAKHAIELVERFCVDHNLHETDTADVKDVVTRMRRLYRREKRNYENEHVYLSSDQPDEREPTKTKLFISQPMTGVSIDAFNANRERILRKYEKYFKNCDYEVINPYTRDDAPEDADKLWYLGRALMDIGSADIVIFAKNADTAKGCIIERMVCELYNIEHMNESELGENEHNPPPGRYCPYV